MEKQSLSSFPCHNCHPWQEAYYIIVLHAMCNNGATFPWWGFFTFTLHMYVRNTCLNCLSIPYIYSSYSIIQLSEIKWEWTWRHYSLYHLHFFFFLPRHLFNWNEFGNFYPNLFFFFRKRGHPHLFQEIFSWLGNKLSHWCVI